MLIEGSRGLVGVGRQQGEFRLATNIIPQHTVEQRASGALVLPGSSPTYQLLTCVAGTDAAVSCVLMGDKGRTEPLVLARPRGLGDGGGAGNTNGDDATARVREGRWGSLHLLSLLGSGFGPRHDTDFGVWWCDAPFLHLDLSDAIYLINFMTNQHVASHSCCHSCMVSSLP